MRVRVRVRVRVAGVLDLMRAHEQLEAVTLEEVGGDVGAEGEPHAALARQTAGHRLRVGPE